MKLALKITKSSFIFINQCLLGKPHTFSLNTKQNKNLNNQPQIA